MNNQFKNPFNFHRLYHYKHAFDDIYNKNIRILDYGSGNGEFLGLLTKTKRNILAFGYDVNKNAFLKSSRKYKDVKFKYGEINSKLPYKNSYFDTVLMFHVLEHVDSEKRAIKEVHRVLKKGGVFILSSPYKGLFAWADAANLRYISPKLHKLFYRLFYGTNTYNKLFLSTPKRNLFGDSSVNRTWHTHYSIKDIKKLLKERFSIIKLRRYSLFQPFLLDLINIWYLIFKNENLLLNLLVWLDNHIPAGNWSYNFYFVAKK